RGAVTGMNVGVDESRRNQLVARIDLALDRAGEALADEQHGVVLIDQLGIAPERVMGPSMADQPAAVDARAHENSSPIAERSLYPAREAERLSLFVFHVERSDERAGYGPFRQFGEPIFVAPDQVAAGKKAGQRERKHERSQRVVDLKQHLAEDVAAAAEHRGPDHAAGGVGYEKCTPRHSVQSGKE